MKTEVMKHEQFGEVRTVVLDAEKFFAGRDVAAAPGYKKPDLFLNKHVKREDKRLVLLHSLPLSPSSVMRNTVVVNKNGVAALCAAAFCDDAADIKAWLLNADKPALFDKVGYIDDKGSAWFNAEFVARGLGFVQVKNDRVPNYGDKLNLFGNDNYINDNYTVVRWERVNSYLREFGFDKEVAKDDFLPENIVYRLAMKANNETAVQFQIQIANEILPSIRKHGYYSVNEPVETSLFPDDESVKAKKKRRPLPEYAVVYAALLDNALVKIGLTCDFNRRIKEVRKETGLDVEEVFTTDFMPLDDARKLEAAVKAKFHEKNKGGELYDAPFEQVKTALLDKHDDKFDKLLALANILPDSEEKTRLVLQAASLI